MIKQTIVTAAFFVSALLHLDAQGTNDPKLPEFLPPSPEVSSLMKGAELSVTPHTGGATSSIPVYQIKMKTLSLPISLNYSTNGFKPEELPSRVGLGWNLNAGGVVSRTVQGKPDDDCTFPTPPDIADLNSYTQSALTYLNAVSDPRGPYESMPDEYHYTLNGLSGKFYIKRDGSIMQLPYNNVKIGVNKTGFSVNSVFITDGNGIVYTFNGFVEHTLSHNMENNLAGKQDIKTAWHLSAITAPNGENIQFHYVPIQIHTVNSYTESIEKPLYDDRECACNNTTPVGCPSNPVYSSKYAIAHYAGFYLSHIDASDGTTVNFLYEQRPDESTGEIRLKTVSVYNTQLGRVYKNVLLDYSPSDGVPSGLYGKRFFLNTVTVADPVNASGEQQAYKLEYVEGDLPDRFTTAKDHLGFYNGAINSNLLSATGDDEGLFNGYANADRSPHGEFAKMGLLKRITLPTGGSDEFFYEPNVANYWGDIPVTEQAVEHVEGIGNNQPVTYTSSSVHIDLEQDAQFYVTTSWIGGGTPCCSQAKSSITTIVDNATNGNITSIVNYGYVQNQQTIHLQAGHTYTINLQVRQNTSTKAIANLVYVKPQTTVWGIISQELCGVRVRKVQSFDPVSNKKTARFYKYWSLTDTVHASANKVYQASYVSDGTTPVQCPCAQNVIFLCRSKIVSSNSAIPLFMNDAAGVTYKWVIESDDSLYANGGIEHTFRSQGGLVGGPALNYNIAYKPSDAYNFMNGTEVFTRYFDNQRAVVKTIKNQYSLDPRHSELQLLNYNIRKRFEMENVHSPLTADDFANYDVEQYSVYTQWDHLDYTETKEFDALGTALTTRVDYTYGSNDYAQPTTVATTSSEGNTVETRQKFPSDFAAPGTIYQLMVGKNIVEPSVEQSTWQGTKLLTKSSTAYKDWYADGTVLTPETVSLQKGTNVSEPRIHFYKYDVIGNAQELAKEDGMRIAYLWNYEKTLPVAEFKNASLLSGSIAYTSFESDEKGEWMFAGTAAAESWQPTGTKSYNLTNGSLVHASNFNTPCYVTYWLKGGSGTASVNGSSGVAMLSVNGWTCYRHSLTGANATLAGTGTVDEVRLYPVGAMVTTYTYLPGIGVATVTDANNHTTYFEYDAFNRLLRTRGYDLNIIKEYTYGLGTPIVPCPNALPNWVATGVVTCQKNNPQNNNNTGYKQREERDLNNCSPTYLQTRWVLLGTSSECPIVPACTGLNKRVVNGVCQTGRKVYTRSVFYAGVQNWTCYFHYEWTDGYKGPEWSETTITPCAFVVDYQ